MNALSRFGSPFLVLVALGLGACASPPSETTGGTGSAIVGGEKEETAFDPAIVELISSANEDSLQMARCTATFIAPRLLLTAAHCVLSPDDSGELKPMAKFTLQTSADEDSAPDDAFIEIRPENVHPHPAHTQAPGPYDVAVIVVDESAKLPSNIVPIPINREPLGSDSVGKPVRLVGYGLTNVGSDTTAKRTVTVKLEELLDAEYALIGGEGKQACEGDSGGPALMAIDGVETVIGTVSTVVHGDCQSGGANYELVDAFTDFIDPYLNGTAPADSAPAAPTDQDDPSRSE